jgi:hypothetical protein
MMLIVLVVVIEKIENSIAGSVNIVSTRKTKFKIPTLKKT